MTNLLPRCDLSVVPDSGDVGHPARLGSDIRRLSDEERPGHARPLLVILDPEVSVDVRRIRAESRQRREHDAVAELDVANLDGLEQGGRGHDGLVDVDWRTGAVMGRFVIWTQGGTQALLYTVESLGKRLDVAD